MQPAVMLLVSGVIMFSVIEGLSLLAHYYTLNGIKSKTVGDGQHGTARFATKKEIEETYVEVAYEPEKWRKGENLPTAQGLVLGSIERAGKLYALVDTGDVHCLMIGAAGVGKTAHFLYPNIEYACACGMSFLTTDTKGDLYRNYAGIAKKYYGYQTAVIDLRNPTRSDGDNMLHLVNKYMDEYLADHNNLSAKAKAEKYAKITAKTIISSGGADSASYGQNAFFYDAAEGVLTAVILLIAEFCPKEKRHIISVFKLIQDLLAPSKVKGRNQFQLLMAKLPDTHKAKWFAGAALNTAEQSMQSVLSTALSRLNSFRDWEAYRFIGKIDTSSHGYTYEMLGNSRKSSFFQNYRERQESSLGSRTELFWMVQSFEHNGSVELEKCEVLETPPESCLEGDMNPFLGNTIFPMETRKILALYFRRKGQKNNFCEDMVRFFVSQIQLSVCEYKCVGILQDKGV